jgi:hypothetical protein
MLLSISAIGAALLLYWAGISGADVGIFHVLYISLIVLLALMCTSTNMRSGLVVTSLSVVLVTLWVFVNASYGQPVLYDSDLNTEWRIVQHLVLNGRLPQLTGETKLSIYAIYPGLELVAASLELVSGVAAYDFLTYGGAVLSGVTVWLVLTLYRRLLPQGSLATKAFVVAAFSCPIVSYGALAIHQTLALVFVCLALVGLSLARKSPFPAGVFFCLASLATIVSHILTGFLFLMLIALYVVCTWILKRPLDRNMRMIQGRHLLLYATIFVTWNVWISTTPTKIGLYAMLAALSFSWHEYAVFAVTPTGTKPAWVVALTFLGFVLYGLITLVGLFASIRSRLSKLAKLIPIGLSGGAIFLVLFCLPIGGLRRVAPGLQARGFLYAYLFGAPLFVVGLYFVSTRKPLALRSRVVRTRILPMLILAVVLSPAVYYGFPAYLYDRTSPLTGLDTRLGHAAEHGAYVFASRYSSTPEVLAVDIVARMATDPDPGTGIEIRSLTSLVPDYYDSVGDLVRGECRTMIIRQSITRVPDSGYTVSTADYQYLLVVSNIVYSSGDPLVLYTTYCASGPPS